MTLLSLLPMLGVSQDMALPTLAKMGAQNGSSQSFGAGAFQTLTNWTSLFDTAPDFVAATGLYTAPAAAYYQITAGILTGVVPQNTNVYLSLFVGATEALRGTCSGPTTSALTNGSAQFGGVVHANKNDVLRLALTNFTGATIALFATPIFNYWTIAQLL